MKRKARILALALGTMFVVSSTFCLSSTKIIDETLNLAEQTARQIFSQSEEETFGTVSAQYLSGLDGEKDYILVNRHPQGYAIFEKENMELMEYSEVGGSPYSSIDKNEIYYAGPAGYYQKEEDNVTHIYTKETIKAEEKEKIAQKVKGKIKKEKLEREEKKKEEKDIVEKEEKPLSNTISNASTISLLGAGQHIDDSIEGAITGNYNSTNKKYITDYHYFLLDPAHGTNGDEGANNSCGIVATQLLLSYNNWSKDGRIITNPDFLLNRTGIYNPYDDFIIGTTSETTFKKTDIRQTSFFRWLLDNIIWSDIIGSSMLLLKQGIEKYLDEEASQVAENISVGLYLSDLDLNTTPCRRIESEINAGRPTLVRIWFNDQDYETVKVGHCVVVYGYQTFQINGESLDGYIAHFGWGADSTNTWFRKSWVESCLTFEVEPHGNNGNLHNDVMLYDENGTARDVVRCTVCNRIAKSGEIHNYEYLMLDSSKGGYHTFHQTKCFCGYKVNEYHDLVYSSINLYRHKASCSKCYYYMTEEHSDKFGYCFYCGQNLLDA